MAVITRRDFILRTGCCTAGMFCLGSAVADPFRAAEERSRREAYFYTVTPRGVKCGICPNECTLRPGEESICHNRVNYKDKLYSIAYGNPCAVHVDPIEKKPLFHFLPQSRTFSIATAGCNFACLNCQNWEISQTSPAKTRNSDLFPKEVVSSCLGEECQSIAYTYSEPVSFYEYMFDTAKLAREKQVKNVMVSNGFINQEPLKKLIPYLDAANIDLKAFDKDLHLKLTGGTLQPVLDTLLSLKKNKVWLEITNLIVPSWTDDQEMIRRMCQWLVSNGFAEVPLHFSRFYPLYKLTQLPMTPLSTLIKAREIAQKEGCKFVYIGNVPGKGYENTYCPSCKKMIMERSGFSILSNNLEKGRCKFCQTEVSGVWE